MQPETISHYRVGRLIGVGGMGEVYLADDWTLNRKVALKLLPARYTQDEERVRRFQREARAASALNHPNIITIYEIGHDERTHFIATEFIEGETLRERMAGRRMTIGEIIDAAIGVASALVAAHGAGIIHRDIKPENVMLRPDGYVKVLDFGLAKLAGDGAAMAIDSNTGAVMGTLFYISPEQARGIAPDARSDVYSLGAVMYEMITGRPPITGESLLDLAFAIANKDPEPPSQIVPGLPAELDRIVCKALSKDRELRYQDAAEMLRDLKALRQQLDFEHKLTQLAPAPQGGVRPAPTPIQSTLRMTPVRGLVHRIPRGAIAIVTALLLLGVVAVILGRGMVETPIRTVAVLPFVNAAGDPNSEYLSDGISESIIDSLSQLPNLQVTARSKVFRYKGKNLDPLNLGRELGVRGVVTGQLIQHGNTIVIRASLTDVEKGTQIWGQQYNRDIADVLGVQQELAEEISGQLRRRLSGEEKKLLIRRNAENSEAFRLYLKGRYYRMKFTEAPVRKSIEYFNQAIDNDPTYALAYAGLADAYYAVSNLYMAPREAMPRARAAAERAVQLDDSLAEGHAALALVKTWYDWDFQAGEREFRRAITLNPNDAEAHRRYADLLDALGQFDRGLAEKRRAVELDPLSLVASWDYGYALYLAGKYREADDQAQRTIDLDDHFPFPYVVRALVAMRENRLADARADMRQAFELGGRSPNFVSHLGYIEARIGDPAIAVKLEEELRQRPTYTLPLFFARLDCALGKRDDAFEWLEKAYNDRSESMVWLKVDPSFEPLRDDPRFLELEKRVGLPQK